MKVKLELFEGPLDLLLYLIRKDHIDIHNIPIARILEQYLQYLDLMRMLDINIASEYLVMAATLMHIKSRELLPQSEGQSGEEDEEDPRQELIRRLLEYKKFKEAAVTLGELEVKRREMFTRCVSSPDEVERFNEGPYFEASLFDLIAAFSKVLKEVPKGQFMEIIKDEFTVAEKLHELLHLLLERPKVIVGDLFKKAKSKLEIVAIFLAILELIRLKEAIVYQERLFGDIIIVRNDRNIEPRI
jgi:segregation and condensation protein A